MRSAERIVLGLVLLAGAASVGCTETKSVASSTFYERKIGPILKETCSNSPTQSGCHVAADDRGNALGNLNLTSYETLSKRPDLLIPYGPYLMPGLLVKAVPPFQVRLTTWQSADPIIITTDIPHAGGSLIDVTSASFNEIVQWITRGATENNAVAQLKDLERAPCSETVGVDPEFDSTVDPPGGDYQMFQSRVSTVLGSTCAAGNCHGSPTNSLYLTCGDTPEQKRWNYFAAGDYVSVEPEASELLRRALAPNAGGTYHEGGTLFLSTGDPGYQAILEWAKAKGGPTHLPTEPGFFYFADNVQPMLVKKGCMIIGCHSPAMGHEYRLRSGSGGHFGLPATRRNYALTLEQVALDSPDPNVSRLLRKNLVPYVAGTSPAPQTPLGILHRGGSLFGEGRTDCSASADAGAPPDGGGVGVGLDAEDPYCVIRRWIEIERAARTAGAPGLSSIVYVRRPGGSAGDGPLDFESFTPGADVIQAPASLAADGTLSVQPGTSLLGPCGLPAGVDVRRPAVSWDAARVAFSARESASTPWRVYVVEGGACALEPTIDAAPTNDQGGAVPSNGELVHNFDPAFAPDGRLVFASTRGNVSNVAAFDYQGPQRSPADPSRLNSNLYVVEDQRVRQLTFLLNQEMTPSFLSDGRLSMVTEKRAPQFYQLAGRRLNLDGGDYHPLFGQRATIGYRQVTDIVELADKNFAAIFSDPGAAHGAGALGVVNRSIGVDHQSAEATDYLQDEAARDWPNPAFFQHSVRVLDGNGRVGQGGGAYRNPTPLPDGRVLVAFAPDVPDLASFPGGFGLVVVDTVTGNRSAPVVTDADDLAWPVAVYARYSRGVYASKFDEPNGATRISRDEADRATAEVTILDIPLFASLVFQNTRSRRGLSNTASLEVWEELPPDPGVTSYDAAGAFVVDDAFGRVHVKRRLRGTVTGLSDGSGRFRVPGGIPVVLAPAVQLTADSRPTRHHQLEQMQFYPGERVNQGFRRNLFNGVCGSCHGAVSGYESDVAVNPDILTQASRVQARTAAPEDLTGPGSAPQGPPFP